MTLAELWDALKAHDWYYAMSDDHGTYKRGAEAQSRLQAEAEKVEGGTELYAAFAAHYRISGERAPLPERPAE